ncbi:hypothetical protein DFP72DRAFT_929954 [Ephemerocybe angulata]|uniref:Secreted protein n=1 Tax=Ephemerocybe angulata TaxID=980116 RepID=A0A8H6HDG1_9AGAR|nr:hypothetical protein DFP72DRAFT_929954 [Tulosesus angulatus]
MLNLLWILFLFDRQHVVGISEATCSHPSMPPIHCLPSNRAYPTQANLTRMRLQMVLGVCRAEYACCGWHYTVYRLSQR